MRLWHQRLITLIPRQQLLGQHRECCALRGEGWERKHSTVNYVFKYSPARLYMYHLLVMREMLERNYNPGEAWFNCSYRGKKCEPYKSSQIKRDYLKLRNKLDIIYPEHDDNYLQECIDNLLKKGVICKYLEGFMNLQDVKN